MPTKQDSLKTVELAPHEFDANLLYNDDGLAPFFGLDSAVKDAGGSKTAEFSHDHDRWCARLSYQPSNIVNPGEETPAGTEWRIQEMREYRIRVFRHPDEDEIGQQDFTAHVAPRWPGMEAETNDGDRVELPVPDNFTEGINVRVQGSNIAFERYPELLQIAASTLGIAGRYFENPHPFSNIQDAERYVRVDKDQSGPVHARDGPLASMAHLLENDRSGYRKVVQNDDDGKGRNRPGYYHTTTLDSRRVREAFPDHRLPKEIKHYYAREAVSVPDDSPLAHPKVGASLQVSLLDDDEKVSWHDHDRLRRELDQTVLSVLADAGLDVAPGNGPGPFVEDAYFTPEVSRSGPKPINLDISHVRQNQESVVVRQIADGLAPTQWDALETLVTDGGEVSPADIADEQDRHVGSVRQALRDMDDLVQREYANVSLRSEYVAELVHEAVSEARDACRRASETAGKALEAAERGMGETMSAFIAWAARHGVDVEDSTDARMKLRMGDISPGKIEKAVREGFRVWKDAGMPEVRFREALVLESGGAISEAWRYI